MAPDTVLDELRQAVRADFPAVVDELSALVRIPAMAWDSFDPSDLHRAASHVAALVRDAGIAETDLFMTIDLP